MRTSFIPSRSCSDLRCIDGHRRNPICCLAEIFTRCAQVLPQPVCSLSLRRPALLYSTRSERCDYSWSFRLWLPIVKTCAHRAKIFSGMRARFRLSFSESTRRGQNEAICEELPIGNLPSKKLTWANREPCAANLLHRGGSSSHIADFCPRRRVLVGEGVMGDWGSSRFYSLARASFPPCSSSFTFIWMMLLYRGLSRSSV